MAQIIAGRFRTFEQADVAVQALVDADFSRDDVNVFYVNPPGQHHTTPIGGDHLNADPGAEDSTNEAVTVASAGGAIGLALGVAVAAAIPAVGAAAAVAAAGVGAYTGSLAGSLSGAGEKDQPTQPPRSAGVLVSVRLNDDESMVPASVVLTTQGAEDVEVANGTWQDGEWIDFDPVTPARLITTPAGRP